MSDAAVLRGRVRRAVLLRLYYIWQSPRAAKLLVLRAIGVVLVSVTRVLRIERLRAFYDDGEIYLAYSKWELFEDIGGWDCITAARRWRYLYELPAGVILENEETGERVDVNDELLAIGERVKRFSRSDVRNHGMVAQLWTCYT